MSGMGTCCNTLPHAPPKTAPRFLVKGPDTTTSCTRESVSEGDAILLGATKREPQRGKQGVHQHDSRPLTDTYWSMTLKEPLSHFEVFTRSTSAQSYICTATGGGVWHDAMV